jgi:hypothetical protein
MMACLSPGFHLFLALSKHLDVYTIRIKGIWANALLWRTSGVVPRKTAKAACVTVTAMSNPAATISLEGRGADRDKDGDKDRVSQAFCRA